MNEIERLRQVWAADQDIEVGRRLARELIRLGENQEALEIAGGVSAQEGFSGYELKLGAVRFLMALGDRELRHVGKVFSSEDIIYWLNPTSPIYHHTSGVNLRWSNHEPGPFWEIWVNEFGGDDLFQLYPELLDPELELLDPERLVRALESIRSEVVVNLMMDAIWDKGMSDAEMDASDEAVSIAFAKDNFEKLLELITGAKRPADYYLFGDR